MNDYFTDYCIQMDLKGRRATTSAVVITSRAARARYCGQTWQALHSNSSFCIVDRDRWQDKQIEHVKHYISDDMESYNANTSATATDLDDSHAIILTRTVRSCLLCSLVNVLAFRNMLGLSSDTLYILHYFKNINCIY